MENVGQRLLLCALSGKFGAFLRNVTHPHFFHSRNLDTCDI
jgi:hypothetical protein